MYRFLAGAAGSAVGISNIDNDATIRRVTALKPNHAVVVIRYASEGMRQKRDLVVAWLDAVSSL